MRGKRVTLSRALRVPGRNRSFPSRLVFVATPQKMKSRDPRRKNEHRPPAPGSTPGAPEPTFGNVLGESDELRALS